MKKSILLFLFSLVVSHVFSESDWRNGYIIKNNGDTIYGFIDYRDSRSNSKKCFFKKEIKDTVTIYEPKAIFGYRIVEGKYFISRSNSDSIINTPVFLEFLIQGKINIYHIQDENDRYFVEKDKLFLELKNTEGRDPSFSTDAIGQPIVEKDLIYDKNEYIGLLTFLLHDGQIESTIKNSKLEANSLINVAKTYHQKVCSDEKCIIYEKEIKRNQLSVGFHIGTSLNSFNFGSKIQTNYAFGELIGIRLNIRNVFTWHERISFTLDATLQHYSWYSFKSTDISVVQQIWYKGNVYDVYNIPTANTNNNLSVKANVNAYMIKLPLTVNYHFSMKKVQPYMGAGIVNAISIYESKDFTNPSFYFHYKNNFPHYNIGLVGKVGSRIMLKNNKSIYSELNYEYISNLNMNQSYRLTNNSFSLLLGYSF